MSSKKRLLHEFLVKNGYFSSFLVFSSKYNFKFKKFFPVGLVLKFYHQNSINNILIEFDDTITVSFH